MATALVQIIAVEVVTPRLLFLACPLQKGRSTAVYPMPNAAASNDYDNDEARASGVENKTSEMVITTLSCHVFSQFKR